MGPKTTALIEVLDQTASLLRANGEEHWSKWMHTSSSRLKRSDYTGIELLLSAYGGMGSFNDLIICQPAEIGKIEWSADAQNQNNMLDTLRGRAYELAQHIKHNHDVGNT